MEEIIAKILANTCTQAEYTQFYKELRRFTGAIAVNLFSDYSLREAAIDAALDEFTRELTEKGKIARSHRPMAYIKTIVANHLKRLAKKRKIEPSYFKDADKIRVNMALSNELGSRQVALGYKAYEVLGDPLTVKQRIIKLHARKVRNVDIARKLDVSKSYVTQVLQDARKVKKVKSAGTNIMRQKKIKG